MEVENAVAETKKSIFIVPDACLGQRLDKVLAQLIDGQSRSTLQSWIKQGLVLVDDEQASQKDKLYGGEQIEVSVPQMESNDWIPQEMDLTIIYEDTDMLVINKPAGLVVHPGAGNPDGTLLNGLLFRYPHLAQLARAGIVHRLDKDTSGLMVVAKTEAARLGLIEQLADHSLHREYFALVIGRVISGGSVDEPIARDKGDRRKMAVNMMGKQAISHYRVAERFREHTLLQVQLETGRTHQIRVHMNHLGFPLVGDPVYGRRLAIPKDSTAELEAQLRQFKRQALHAKRIAYHHPISGEEQAWECELPEDMATLISACEKDAQEH